jgi:hypothetical protein
MTKRSTSQRSPASSKSWGEGTTRGARKARAEALEHADYQCQLRLPGCTTDDITTKSIELKAAE